MSKSVEAIPNPPLLVWARESVGFSLSEVATRAEIEEAVLASWEAGTSRPTVAKLRKLAEIYKRPIAAFYLPEPPKAFDAMRFFRRHPGEQKPDPSPELAIEIRDAEARREVALELADVLGEAVPTVALKANPSDSPGRWAREARAWLRITVGEQSSWRDEYEAYRAWRTALERAGLLVFQFTGIGREVRGFSIDADKLPVIAVNSKDSVRARIFTVFHELGHLLLGVGELDEGGWSASTDVEVFCNEFAGQFLVPPDALAADLADQPAGRQRTADLALLKRLTRKFWVSEEVIMLRLVAANRLARQGYEERRAELLTIPPRPTGPVKYPTRKVAALGRPFVRAVLAAMHGDHITISEASDHLGMKLKHFPEVERLVLTRSAEAV